jgi:hypothetical protein
MSSLKSISYRGGIARFEIPSSWKEEYEPAGGATFYEDKPDSGTLRLNVLGFSSNGQQTGEEMIADVIAKSGFRPLHRGLAMRRYVKISEEDGEQLSIHYWEIAVPIEGCGVRLAVFSYTTLASQANDPQTQCEINLLARCIESADFSREQGVSGDFEHE